ncbi:MAG: prepilin-type N-terminal cleavage/methylation domain-containing protein [Nitrospirae bacterium]|nr:MAG: prepilin-type N-terminal cleavage/methylation domain-containing protein [Nitrospirota bacterium]
MRSVSRQKGFTLLEVLLAVGLLVVVVSAVYGTFSLAERAYNAYRQYGVRLQQARTALTVLKRELQSCYYNEKDPFSVFSLKTREYYERKLSELEFTTVEGPRPPLRIRYSVEERDDKLVLYKKVSTLDGNEMDIEVLQGVYFFSVTADDGSQSLEVYNAEKTRRLPRSLRVSIGIIYNEEPLEISMTVNPRSEVFKW